ncbi:hypothetical protein [Fundicoccus culcitae]|uniref:Uncharacterized protein n=1 Tax=Fundicoccus culcitae TaxID=2969821 RepID=A0ABY5P7W9_9LACT|nr:hypothetical protein [Fundicoccus culcitae]UUX34841.1 hypothetical protein NRE15_04105 [Fundicoccus culcitae]
MSNETKHNIVILIAFIVVSTLNYYNVISINTDIIGVATVLMYKLPNKINQHIIFN